LTWRDKQELHRRLLPLVSALLVIPSLTASDIDSSALQKDAALVISASGQVSTEAKGQEWAVDRAERIWVTKPIFTGADGYARLQVSGGTAFEIFAHTRVLFRNNPGNPRDLLDVETGRVRLRVENSKQQPLPTRVLTPGAVITCHGPALFAIAVDDEDNSTRVDVQQGEVAVRHALIPNSQPVIVRAGDAIAVEADERLISRRLDRGSSYRDAFHTIWKTLESSVPGHSNKSGKNGESAAQFRASRRMWF
jgi:ferric-dicitrate binding protein FerR (iron transport regulator)